MTTLLEATEVAVESAVAPLPPVRERLVALDVFRGITVASMLLVNNPGSWSKIYPPLEHAPWHGWTPTDLIFPFFLFIVGITTHLSLSRRDPGTIVGKIIRRGLLIVLAGLLLNAFPFYWWGTIAGVPEPTLLQRVVYRLQHLRFAGVLQRIGIAYIFSALLTLRTSLRQQIAIVVSILIGYWLLMTLVPVPGTGTIGYFVLDQPSKTLAAWTDRAILGANHIWVSSKTWDPEGPLSTIPAIATAILGVLAARWVTDRKRSLLERIIGLYGAGCLGMAVGLLWSWVFPINKSLWTSSYVIFTAGFACVALATCLWILDVHHVSGWSKPFVIYGVNPLVAFVGSGMMARLTDSVLKTTLRGRTVSVHQASYEILCKPYFAERFGSLLWALGFVTLWLGILSILHRRNIVVKL